MDFSAFVPCHRVLQALGAVLCHCEILVESTSLESLPDCETEGTLSSRAVVEFFEKPVGNLLLDGEIGSFRRLASRQKKRCVGEIQGERKQHVWLWQGNDPIHAKDTPARAPVISRIPHCTFHVRSFSTTQVHTLRRISPNTTK